MGSLIFAACLACDLRLLDKPDAALRHYDELGEADRTGYLQSCASQLSGIFSRALQDPSSAVGDEAIVSVNRFQALAGILRDSQHGFNAQHWSIILGSLNIIRPFLNKG